MSSSTLSAEALGVSRETHARLARYVHLLRVWNARVNLVSRLSLDDAWRRHVLDSAQLMPLIPAGARVLVDLGSGAGFPGLVLSILGVPEVHLIESDARKCAFLREAARATGANATIHVRRIEAMTPFPADVVTARALAPLPQLLELASPFLQPHTMCVFLKGKNAAEELREARSRWRMDETIVPSLTDPEASVVVIRQAGRA
ncbi:MAG: 16S rRNA (guanine(527)-N(7))-methyltransferase RsmG [Rhodospirillales bacterium]|nr:16S rRNA (guanine(527)-N(7))-methyltransferase RsmG [Rhodospirillales bacterium]